MNRLSRNNNFLRFNELALTGMVTLFFAGVATAEEDENENVEEEIIVTGTRISNVPATSQVSIISRNEMDIRGLSSVEDVLRYVPQNYSTITSGALADGRGVRFVDGATTVDLRGLGSGSTLVLVNGKRIAASPSESGTFTDISTIPFGAIDRVEVLSDGASAIYGSDAVGGVINIIMKKDYQGAQTKLRYEDSSSGGSGFTFDQTLGLSWGTGNVTANFSISEQDAVDRYKAGLSDETDFTSQGGRLFPSRFTQAGQPPAREPLLSRDLTPESETKSLYLNLSQEITDKLSFNIGGQYSKRESESQTISQIIQAFVPPSNFYNTSGGPRIARYAFLAETDSGALNPIMSSSISERQSLNVSLDWELPYKDWELTLGYSQSEDEITGGRTTLDSRDPDVAAAIASDDPAIALNLFGDGATQLSNLNDLLSFIDNGTRIGEQEVLTLGVGGTMLSLPNGDVEFAAGIEMRDDTLDLVDYRLNPLGRSDPSLVSFAPESENEAYFVEVFIPLITSDSQIQGVKELSLHVAGRSDQYEFTGPFDGFDSSSILLPFSSRDFDDFVPKVGVVWRPIESLKIRATWGEAFQTPTLPELFIPPEIDDVFTSFWFDPENPASNGGPDFVEVPSVFGGNPNLQPQTSETVTLGFDYESQSIEDFSITMTYNKTEFVGRLGNLTDVFGFSDIFGTTSTPLANWEQFPNAVQRDANGVLTFYDPFGTFNLSSRTSESLDFYLRKGFEVGEGRIELGLFGTHTLSLEDVAAPGVPTADIHGTDAGPPEWNMHASIDWVLNNWRASAVINHTDSYKNTDLNALRPTIDGYTTVDVNGTYELLNTGWKLNAGITNLFDEDFPFVDSNRGVDSSRVDFRRRVLYLELSKEFSF